MVEHSDAHIVNAKSELRRAMRSARSRFSTIERQAESCATCEQLIAWWQEQRSPLVASYAAAGSELDLDHFHQQLWSQGASVVLPRVDLDASEPTLDWWAVPAADYIIDGWRGIPEPDHQRCEQVSLDDVQVVCTPGLAFDREGHRLGQGGGFYDRSLARAPQTIGIAYSCQLVDAVPVADHDQIMDQLIIGGDWLKIEAQSAQ